MTNKPSDLKKEKKDSVFKKRGFKLIDVLLVAHGGHHNDTICIVEEKL